MSHIKKLSLWLGAFGLLMAAATIVQADQNLDIKVTIGGSKAVTAPTTYYNFGALGVSASSESVSALTIHNASTVFIETYTIVGAAAKKDGGGGTDWTLATTPGSDQYSLGAMFSTAQPSDIDGTWANSLLTGAAQTCSATKFGNGNEGQGGSNVPVSGDRNLWFRIKTPTGVTDNGAHTVQLTLSIF